MSPKIVFIIYHAKEYNYYLIRNTEVLVNGILSLSNIINNN